MTACCWLAFVATWLLGWIYNISHAPRVVRKSSGLGLYGVPGAIVVFVVVSLLRRIVPVSFWRAISYWNPGVAVAGVAILVTATAFTLWARWVLGTMWTGQPTIKDQHELRTDGPYAITRHPIYTGLMGMLLGTMLLDGFGGLLVAFVIAGIYCAFKIRTEERLLVDTFGAHYQHYRERVPAIIPLLRHA